MATGLKFKFDNSAVPNSLLVQWFAASAPLAEAGRQVYPPGSGAGQANAINQLTPTLTNEVYNFKFWNSVDGIALTSQVDSWQIDGGKTNQIATVFSYKVGRGNSGTSPNWADPADGSDTLTDQNLIGATYSSLEVEFRGIGKRAASEFNILLTGGIQLIGVDINTGAPEKFIQDTWIFITYYQQLQQSFQTPQAIWADVKDVSANATLDTTYFNNIVNALFSIPMGIITLPAFSSIPNFTRMLFLTEGSTRYVKILFQGADTVKREGVDVNYIILCSGEKLELFFKSSKGYITDISMNRLIGVSFLSDRSTVKNAHLMAGGEDNISDYQRLIDILPAEMKVTYGQYDTDYTVTIAGTPKIYKGNRGKFAIDVASGKFKWPDRRGYWMRGLTFVDGSTDGSMITQGAGGIWPEEIIAHKHGTLVGSIGTNGLGSSRSGGAYNGPRTGVYDYTDSVGGSEQQVDSVGGYPMIFI